MYSYYEISLEEVLNAKVLQTIVFPLTVPTDKEVEDGWEKLDLSKSNLNACYSKPEINERSGQERSWFDVTLTVEGEHNLPPKKEWFYVVTRYGDCFKAHFIGKKTKKLVSLEDRNIIGYFIKSMVVDWELFTELSYCFYDPEGRGIITKEMLENRMGSKITLRKTNKTKTDGRGNKRDIWIFSFPIENEEEGWERIREKSVSNLIKIQTLP